jgi:oxygen-independent coproporphyrinogen-3 oxidase
LLLLASDTEFTVEVNPDDIHSSKLVALRDLGVNRISLGVQSFDDQDLRFLKRRHTADQAVKAIDGFKGAAFAKVGLDLMYGLPGQTESSWLKTLGRPRFNPSTSPATSSPWRRGLLGMLQARVNKTSR